jgi:hypothetical protein
VALSSTEAEFIAATEASKELLWLKRFVIELGFDQGKYVLFCDSQSAIHLCKNASLHFKSKHIDVRYHWIQDVLYAKELYLEKVHTDDNGADMLTKVMTKGKLRHIARSLAWLLEGSENLHVVGRGSLLGYLSTWKMKYGAQQISFPAHKSSTCEPLISTEMDG